MKSAQGVCEARMFGTLVREKTKAQLFDPTQALKLGRVDQTHHQLTLIAVGAKPDDVVNWISIDAF